MCILIRSRHVELSDGNRATTSDVVNFNLVDGLLKMTDTET